MFLLKKNWRIDIKNMVVYYYMYMTKIFKNNIS